MKPCRSKRVLLLLLSIFLVANCGKDEPSRPGVTELPTIDAVTPAPWQVVTGSVAVQVEATRADQVALFADDQPVDESQSPFQLTWDTSSLPNGRHRLRLVATNGLGDVDSTLDVVTENPGQGVAVVAPLAAVHLRPGASLQMTVIVVGAANRDVEWLLPSDGVGAGLRGSVDTQGLYTAPRHVPDPPIVTVIARSMADPTRFAEVTVEIQGVTVQITPESIDMPVGRTRQFEAHVFGAEDQAVAWSVVEGDGWGEINQSGLYVAPETLPSPPVATIRAVSAAGPAASTTATIHLAGPVRVVIFPSVAHVAVGGSIQFDGTAENAPDDAVDWWVEGGANFGSMTSTGLYTAPATLPDPPEARIWARSRFDTLSVSSAGITLIEITVQITPASIDMPIGRSRQFEARVFGAEDQSVAWSVVEGESRGAISQSGLYVAPGTLPSPPVATIRAVSAAGPAASTTATIHLVGPVRVVIFPSVAYLAAGASIQFNGVAENAPDNGVDWWVEGGPNFGSITSTGLYTAPATLPDPPEARVWARSRFDTLSVASARISSIISPPEHELFAALELMTRSGHRAAMISDQAMNLVVTGLTRAFHLNGQKHTTAGTLRRLGWEHYVYEPPVSGDRRLILLGEGPRAEVTVDSLETGWLEYSFNGGVGGSDFKGYLVCSLQVDGVADLEIVATGVEEERGLGGVEFDRTIRGEVDTGTIWSLDIHDSGNYAEGFHFGTIGHRLAGSITVEGVPLTLDEQFQIDSFSNCHASGSSGLDQSWQINTSASIGSATWAVNGDIKRHVDSRCGLYELVLDPSAWVATGLVTVDGSEIGRFNWTGPVTLGTTPPRAVIEVPGRDPFELVIPRQPEVLIENTVQD